MCGGRGSSPGLRPSICRSVFALSIGPAWTAKSHHLCSEFNDVKADSPSRLSLTPAECTPGRLSAAPLGPGQRAARARPSAGRVPGGKVLRMRVTAPRGATGRRVLGALSVEAALMPAAWSAHARRR